MKRFHWLLLGFAASVCIAAVAPTGGGGSSGVPTLNGTATNLQVYSSGTTNRPLRVFATNGTTEAYFDKDGRMSLGEFGTSGNWLTVYGDVSIYRSSQTALASAFGHFIGGSSGFQLSQSLPFGWHDGSGASVSMDTTLRRSSAGVVEVSGASAGQYRDLRLRTLEGFYSYTDASNYQGFKLTNGATSVTLSAETAGTGADNIDVNITPAGTGMVKLGAGAAKVEIDSSGNLAVKNGFTISAGGSYFQLANSGATYIFNTSMFYGNTPIQIGRLSTGGPVSAIEANSTAVFSWNGDAGVGRNAAGVVEVNNGTAGQYRDLVTRSTFATNASITNITADSYVTTQQTLSYASATNLTVDANKSLHFVSLTNTAYFAQPSNLGVGRTFTVILQQDGTGTRAVTFNTNYWKFPGGVVPTITTNANAYDVLSCISCPYGTNVFAIHNAKFQ